MQVGRANFGCNLAQSVFTSSCSGLISSQAEYKWEDTVAENEVHEVKNVNLEKNTFDGHKADLYINTNTLGGKHFLVKVMGVGGKPTLIAIHL